jgi:mono/diheme cytochrome c family protein
MSRTRNYSAACAIGLLALAAVPALSQTKNTQPRGAYLARIMDCTGCHTPGALMGKPDQARYLAGSDIGFHLPGLGYFWPPNLTPDKETGLGPWSEADIVRAVRTGARPDGRMLAPVMPWHSYAALTDKDARELARYLKGMAAVRNAVPALAGPDATPSSPYLTVVVPKK